MDVASITRQVQEQPDKQRSMQTLISSLENEVRASLTGVAIPTQTQEKIDKMFSELAGQASSLGNAIATDGQSSQQAAASPTPGMPHPTGVAGASGTEQRSSATATAVPGSTGSVPGSTGAQTGISGMPPAPATVDVNTQDTAHPDRDTSNRDDNDKKLSSTGKQRNH